MTDAEALQLLIALGHPARFEIFRNVRDHGHLTTAELNTGKSASTTSHHLKKLVGAGVLEATKSGKELRYCARSEVLLEMGRWVTTQPHRATHEELVQWLVDNPI